MAITLNDIKLNTTDKLVASVVDEFRRSNFLLANMPFDDTLLPMGNGSSPTYSYYRIVTPVSYTHLALYSPMILTRTRFSRFPSNSP